MAGKLLTRFLALTVAVGALAGPAHALDLPFGLGGRQAQSQPREAAPPVRMAQMSDSGVRARGLTFAVAPGAEVRAPAGGTVRYARAFRDYGRILILDHGDGWTSLLTGMAALRVEPGATVTAGQPVGRAARTGSPAGDPARVTVELRRRGRPVDMTALTG